MPQQDRDARIDELEVRLAQADHSINELGDEVYQQQQQIARLESSVRLLSDRLQNMARGASAGDTADDVPPHY